jgi:hypothetical protein
MTDDEIRLLKEFAGQAACLTRQRDRRRISQSKYIEFLDTFRKEYGLASICSQAPNESLKLPDQSVGHEKQDTSDRRCSNMHSKMEPIKQSGSDLWDQ